MGRVIRRLFRRLGPRRSFRRKKGHFIGRKSRLRARIQQGSISGPGQRRRKKEKQNKIDKDRLYITVFEGAQDEQLTKDEESYNIWSKVNIWNI